MFPSKKVNEAHDAVLAMANHASDVFEEMRWLCP